MDRFFMDRVFDFLSSLDCDFFDFYGYPEVKFSSDCVDVYFDCRKTITDILLLDSLSKKSDSFNLIPSDGVIVLAFGFNIDF